MLYIDDMGNNTVRFSDQSGGDGYDRYLPNTMTARSSEIDRVWILNTESETDVVINQLPANITLDGVVYANPGNFVQAFNAMIAGDTLALATTTTTTELATTTTTTL